MHEPSAGLNDAVRSLRAEDLAAWLGPRDPASHKGLHGRVACVGGDHGHGGAILLCAEAALRAGAGLVRVTTREAHVLPLLARIPEAMTASEADDAAWGDVIAIGPGLGQGDWGRRHLARALSCGRPLVLDADALNLVAAEGLSVPADAIATPHPGEAGRLLGCDAAAVQADRGGALGALVAQLGCIVVLKGAGTLVGARGHATVRIAAGGPALAAGGTGDVLTGVIAALRAQGLSAFDAAAAGALLHASAGDAVAADGVRGTRASDLMPAVRRLANP